MSEFEKPDESITTEMMDESVKEMARLKAEYEGLKKQSDAQYHKYQEARAQCISLLNQAGKKKYHVDDVGTINITEKLKVKTPSSPESKDELFTWLESKFGKEGLLSYIGINYQTLNSLYNTEFEEAKLEGTADNFQIPGVGNPEHEYGLSFRK